MDLTEKYMRLQGTAGELVERNSIPKDDKLLFYSNEGCYPEFILVKTEEAEEMLKQWGLTGELLVRRFDQSSSQYVIDKETPDIVSVFTGVETFTRIQAPIERGV
jgi:hypothetical protein